MSQSSDSNIKDISEKSVAKPIEDILEETKFEEKVKEPVVAEEGILSSISSAIDPLVAKVKDTFGEAKEAITGEAEAEEKLDTSKEEPGVQIEKEVILKLGDIIYIVDPTNEILNDNTFIINYIDPTKIKLINVKTFDATQLNVKENGVIGTGTITEIKIISRNPNEGFARQNDLVPGKWINIYFGGDYPTVITGEITNLEEDMIEIRTTDDDTLYINFAYQGIPEKLPIETFEIRPAPDSKKVEVSDEGASEQFV